MCFNAYRCVASAIISILLGVVIGIVFFNALLPGIIAAIIIALAFTALTLILLAIIGVFTKGNEKKCVCKVGKCALVGSIITLILATTAIIITLDTAVLATAIFIGILGATFLFTVFSVAEVIACILKCKCNYEYSE